MGDTDTCLGDFHSSCRFDIVELPTSEVVTEEAVSPNFFFPNHVPSLKLAAKAPEKGPSQKGNSSSNHPFSGANC